MYKYNTPCQYFLLLKDLKYNSSEKGPNSYPKTLNISVISTDKT